MGYRGGEEYRLQIICVSEREKERKREREKEANQTRNEKVFLSQPKIGRP